MFKNTIHTKSTANKTLFVFDGVTSSSSVIRRPLCAVQIRPLFQNLPTAIVSFFFAIAVPTHIGININPICNHFHCFFVLIYRGTWRFAIRHSSFLQTRRIRFHPMLFWNLSSILKYFRDDNVNKCPSLFCNVIRCSWNRTHLAFLCLLFGYRQRK